MYIQETFRKTYESVAANWTNAILYFVPTIAITALGVVAGAGAYLLILLLSLSGNLLKSPFLLSIAVIIGLFVIAAIVLLGVAMNLMNGRVSYLTFKNIRLETGVAALNDIVSYAKANFAQMLKLQMAAAILSLAVIAPMLVAVWLAFAGNAQLAVEVAAAIATVAGIIVLIALSWTFSAAHSLFFMGNEKTGTLALLGKAWGVVSANLAEFAMFWISYGLLTLAFLVAYLAAIFVPVLGSAVGIAISFGFSFFVSVLMLSFVANFASKKV